MESDVLLPVSVRSPRPLADYRTARIAQPRRADRDVKRKRNGHKQFITID
jgi:hypothetical protein